MSMVKKTTPFIMLLLGLALIFIVTAIDAEARSSRKRISYITSQHKFHPDGMSTVSSLPGIYSLFTLQMIEQSSKAME